MSLLSNLHAASSNGAYNGPFGIGSSGLLGAQLQQQQALANRAVSGMSGIGGMIGLTHNMPPNMAPSMRSTPPPVTFHQELQAEINIWLAPVKI